MELIDNKTLKLIVGIPGLIFFVPFANRFADAKVTPYRLKHFEIYIKTQSTESLKEIILENKDDIKEEIEKETII